MSCRLALLPLLLSCLQVPSIEGFKQQYHMQCPKPYTCSTAAAAAAAGAQH
jgi:hypothetical protein